MIKKVIHIKTCGDCLVVDHACGGKKPVCNHPKVAVKRPYATDRAVKTDEAPPSFCPLSDFK